MKEDAPTAWDKLIEVCRSSGIKSEYETEKENGTD